MAVASFHRNGGQVALRGFHPPKTASLSAWYRAAVGQIADAPDWRTVDMQTAEVDAETIIWHGDDWDLFVARKRFLR